MAHGHFQDVFGNVQRRFKVQISGAWDGRTLKLVEDSAYDDADTEQRIWTLENIGEDTWKGTAPGVSEHVGVGRLQTKTLQSDGAELLIKLSVDY